MKTNSADHTHDYKLGKAKIAIPAGLCLGVTLFALAQQHPSAPPVSNIRSVPVVFVGPAVVSEAPIPLARPQPGVAAQPASPTAQYLAWDADVKNFEAKAGELIASFTFYVTNISTQAVIIESLTRACGCTEAKLPEQPWKIAPGAHGPIVTTVDLRGRSGRISKSLTVNTSVGSKVLTLTASIHDAPLSLR